MNTNDHDTVSMSHQRSSPGLSAREPLGPNSFHGCFCEHDFHEGGMAFFGAREHTEHDPVEIYDILGDQTTEIKPGLSFSYSYLGPHWRNTGC